jgi:hypothetical protein
VRRHCRYDSHREQILRAGRHHQAGGGHASEEHAAPPEDLSLYQYFSSSCYEGFTDGPKVPQSLNSLVSCLRISHWPQQRDYHKYRHASTLLLHGHLVCRASTRCTETSLAPYPSMNRIQQKEPASAHMAVCLHSAVLSQLGRRSLLSTSTGCTLLATGTLHGPMCTILHQPPIARQAHISMSVPVCVKASPADASGYMHGDILYTTRFAPALLMCLWSLKGSGWTGA